MSFFPPGGVGDVFGLLYLPLAHAHFLSHDGLLLNRHLLLAHRHAVGFALADGLIGGLARAGTALDVDFLAGDRHIDVLLFGHHIFA